MSKTNNNLVNNLKNTTSLSEFGRSRPVKWVRTNDLTIKETGLNLLTFASIVISGRR